MLESSLRVLHAPFHTFSVYIYYLYNIMRPWHAGFMLKQLAVNTHSSWDYSPEILLLTEECSVSPAVDNIGTMMDVRRLWGKIIGTVLCCVVYDSCAQWHTHACMHAHMHARTHTHTQAVLIINCLFRFRFTFAFCMFFCLFLQRAQWSHCKRCISYSNSVCLSFRLSVCLSVYPSVRHTPVLCQNDGM